MANSYHNNSNDRYKIDQSDAKDIEW